MEHPGPNGEGRGRWAAAAEIGCGWCLDFGFWESFHRGVDPVKLREITNWQESTAYSEGERAAIRYAVAMTQTPPEVTDDMVADLRTRFTDAEVVELTATIALENQRSRTNTALGLRPAKASATTATCPLTGRHPPLPRPMTRRVTTMVLQASIRHDPIWSNPRSGATPGCRP